MKIIELKGKDIIKAYNGNYLSNKFGFSCANFNCEFQNNIKTDIFDIYVDNIENISCFVYINENTNKIEGRRMFFKGKQMLDHNDFPIITKLNDEIYYLYGFYGNPLHNIDRHIINFVISKYPNNIIYLDNGYIDKGKLHYNKEYWIMKIDNMEYNEFPPIDFLYASYELTSLSNFKPSDAIINWLENKYQIKNIKFRMAYHFKPGEDEMDYIKHWNHKYFDNYFKSDDDEFDDEYDEFDD
jgi:hypothetical protein